MMIIKKLLTPVPPSVWKRLVKPVKKSKRRRKSK